jgi:SPP1 gp7 family putative phage head morphogenesis protein
MLSEKEITKLLEDIFVGKIDEYNLPLNLYESIAENLDDALRTGVKNIGASFGGKNLDLINELRTNVYMFSAAKTFQQTRELTDLITDEENNVRTFKDFYTDASSVYDKYNKDYAQTEYRTAIESAQMGVRWNQIQEDKDIFPLLKITVVEDSLTSDICKPLEGITLPVNDPFWDKYYPPNHWNCRSSVLQLDEGKVSNKKEVKHAIEHADDEMQDSFRMNVGKDGYVFSPEHPYFQVPKEDKQFAKENFGLPLPKELTEEE